MPSRKKLTGLEAVVDDAVRDSAPAPGAAAGEQGLLLPLPVVGELGEDAAGEPVAELPQRGARPVRGKSRKTKEWVAYLQARYPSPLVMLAETFSRPVAELQAELGCTKLEAFDRQIEAAKHLAPYMHQKLPTAVEVSNADGVPLWLAVSPAMAAVVGEDGAVVDDEGRLSVELAVDDGEGQS